MQEKHAGYFQAQREEEFLKITANLKHAAIDWFVYSTLLSNAEYLDIGYTEPNGVRVEKGQVYITHREIARKCGLASHRTAAQILKRLENYGVLRCEPVNVKGRGTSDGTVVTILNVPNTNVEISRVDGKHVPNKGGNVPNNVPNTNVEISRVDGKHVPNNVPIIKKDKEKELRNRGGAGQPPLSWAQARTIGGVVGRYGNIAIGNATDDQNVQRFEYAMQGYDIQAFVDRMSEVWAAKGGKRRGAAALLNAWKREEDREQYRKQRSRVEGNHAINSNDERTITEVLTREGYALEDIQAIFNAVKAVWTDPKQDKFRATYGTLVNAIRAGLKG